MIRKGRFAIWNGKEYPIVSQRRNYYLESEKPEDKEMGFTEMGTSGSFFKEVSIDELEDAYEVFPYAMLSGYRFAIESYEKKTGMVTLVTNNPFAQKKVAVTPSGKDEFRIDIPIEEVTILEDRVPILGFDR
ncbi:hypothetical protein MHZ92_06450 [Sporosarcina sp. ACRSL]|uniref:hypothetical protein n=1 Tax=Sporosarcina sp. ACRSL TaxID=2918215 RepID=UPI001EF56789|nr:hypothetical protein [Sporosarcina sp. ACRSL]MCG7343766.1 hypothetical protein [Sporosarcina sp. ACRSL]